MKILGYLVNIEIPMITQNTSLQNIKRVLELYWTALLDRRWTGVVI